MSAGMLRMGSGVDQLKDVFIFNRTFSCVA